MAVQVHFLGTGDAFSSDGRNHTCFFIETGGTNILLDCGATSLTAMHSNSIKTDDIDLILITHFHGDHYGGLPFILLDAMIYRRSKPLTIVLPVGGKEKTAALLKLLYEGTEVLAKLNVEFMEYTAGEEFQIRQVNITAYEVAHSSHLNCYGLRLQIDNTIISYSGDTRWCEALIPLSNQADLFICECCFYETEVDAHMNYKTFLQHKAAITAKQTILTHFDREMIGHLNDIPEECAFDGLVITLV